MSFQKQKGIVLLTTVLILSLLSLLILSQMQMVFLHSKALNQIVKKHRVFYELESEAKRIAFREQEGRCLISEQDPNEVIHLLQKKQGCSFRHKKQDYAYLVEELGVFPCLQTRYHNETYSTQHLRINIRATGRYSAFLQLRVAKLAKLENCQLDKPSFISLGLQSWRLEET